MITNFQPLSLFPCRGLHGIGHTDSSTVPGRCENVRNTTLYSEHSPESSLKMNSAPILHEPEG